MTTLLLHHSAFLEHHVPPGHPERPERLRAILNELDHPDFAGLQREEAPLVPAEVAVMAHDRDYVEALDHARPREGMAQLDPDTIMSTGTWEAALRGIGAATRAVDAVMRGEAKNAFCAVRPPGHHAESDRAMGFCIFNNVAVAARHAQFAYGIKRVAIVDFDVHHGNGTQEIFFTDESVLYGSTHQAPFYPGTGDSSERGCGNIFNAPLRSGADGVAFRNAMDGLILPAVEEFEPELILISAGFDAHWRDPLGELELTETDFGWITRRLVKLAETHANGRIVSMLEGGYDLEGLAHSVGAHVRALMQ